jgi:hypothetical protein
MSGQRCAIASGWRMLPLGTAHSGRYISKSDVAQATQYRADGTPKRGRFLSPSCYLGRVPFLGIEYTGKHTPPGRTLL